jgi:hypothetical protein
MPALLAYCLTTCQTTFSLNPLPQTVPARVTRLNILPFEIPARVQPIVYEALHPVRHRNGPNIRGLADQVDDGPVVLPLLQVRHVQLNDPVPTQTASVRGPPNRDSILLKPS